MPKLITDFPQLVGTTNSHLIAVGDPDTGTLYKMTIGELLSGPQGYVGPTGSQGVQGYIGVTGYQGYQGYQGFQGTQGLQGYQGFIGATGYQGNQGFIGYQGDINASVYNLPVPKLRKYGSDSVAIPYFDPSTNSQGGIAILSSGPVVVATDFTEQQLNGNEIYLEMLMYKRKYNKKKVSGMIRKGGGFIIPSPHYTDSNNPAYPSWHNLTPKFWSRDGDHFHSTSTMSYTPSTHSVVLSVDRFGLDRPNHIKLTAQIDNPYNLPEVIPVAPFLSGRFGIADVKYRTKIEGELDTQIDTLTTIVPIGGRMNSSTNNPTSRYPYSSYYTPLRVAFRYVMWLPTANGGKGQIISGPTSDTLVISHKYFPFKKTGQIVTDDGFGNITVRPYCKISDMYSINDLECWIEGRNKK